MSLYRNIFLVLLFMSVANNAYAYVGPGLGLGAIGAIIGIFVTVVLAIAGVFWYPLKRMFKKRNGMEKGGNSRLDNGDKSEEIQDK